MKAAILLTCFNRKNKTLACLDLIYRQHEVNDLNITVYLVDDGSTDGTSKAVMQIFPDVTILPGDGNLFWNRGMNLAWQTAMQDGYDYYIWINDDVTMYLDAFHNLFESLERATSECGSTAVIVGCFCELNSGHHTYGGFSVKKTLWSLKTKRKLPNGRIQQCDSFNGNLVVIPHDVVEVVGLLDGRYKHSFGDKDYGYRCLRHGIPMYMTPSYVGCCSRNDITGTWLDPDLPLRERYQRLVLPTGIPPAEYFYSYRKNSNSLAGGIALVKLFLRLFFPRLWTQLSQSKSGE